MTDTCTHRRSRLTTPLALVLGAVLVSGTSAYAAATITGAQIVDNSVGTADITNNSVTYADIKDGYVIGNDLQNETITSGKIRNGTVAAADLAPGVANKLTFVGTKQGQSADLGTTAGWQWALSTDQLFTFKVTTLQRFTVQGIVGYRDDVGLNWDVAVCTSVNGGTITNAGPTYGTITGQAGNRFNVPVQADTTASGVTLRVGPCLRGSNADDLIADVSSMTVLMTNP